MKQLWPILLAFIACACIAPALRADAEYDRRLTVGAKIFRHLLPGDDKLAESAREDGAFRIWIISRNNLPEANKAKELLAATTGKNSPSIEASVVLLAELENEARLPHGAFLAEALPTEELRKVIAFANANGVMLFSPFQGDVEAGVATGFVVEAKVVPFLNLKALREAGLTLRPLYLKISKLHE